VRDGRASRRSGCTMRPDPLALAVPPRQLDGESGCVGVRAGGESDHGVTIGGCGPGPGCRVRILMPRPQQLRTWCRRPWIGGPPGSGGSRPARFLHIPYGRSRPISPPLAVDAPGPEPFADPRAHAEDRCLLPHLDRERPGRADTSTSSSRRGPTRRPPLKSERGAYLRRRKPRAPPPGRRWTISAAGAMPWAVKDCNSGRLVE
jgi:hypothetical protein